MVTPNFFEFASDERSQDAFLCWLLSWAKPELKEKNEPLYETGLDFVRSLAGSHGYPPPDLGAVERVHHQYKQADVVARLGGNTALLIEDKVGSGAHSGQLGRYRSALQEEFDEVLPIFLKTRDQSDYEHAREEGYEPFLREDLLEVLQRGADRGVESDIFHDYLSHLRFIQDTVESFENKPVGQWPEAAWKGFYQLLQDELGEGSWKYVANPSGGFMAFYWHSFGSGNSEQYLQLEEEKLCFKISVDEEDRYSELREKWYGRAVEAGEEASIQVRKPDHFGHGGHMTVAVLEGGYLETDEDELIDIDKTVARLRKAEEILTQAATDG
jgi:hypothetical protein